MHVITFFAPKGRAGRTVATITAAMALVEEGKRVHVLDLSDPKISDRVPLPGNRTGYSTGLVAWGMRMRDARIKEDRLFVTHAADYVDFERGISRAHLGKADVILIDTPSRPTDLSLAAVNESHLAVTPATSAQDAALIFDAIADRYLSVMPRLCGLVTGSTGRDEDNLIKSVFFGWPSMDTVLPHSNYLPAQYNGKVLFNGKDRRGPAGVAQQAGRAFGRELLEIADGKTPRQTSKLYVDMPKGTALQHLCELTRQNPHLLQ